MAAKLKTYLLATLVVGLVAYLFLPTSTAPQKKDRIPVRFWHMWTAEWQVVVEDIVERYNQSQDKYEVIPLSVPAAGADFKFLLSTVGGDPPDVMAQWNPVIPTWADNQLLYPLDDLMTDEEKERFKRDVYPIVQKVGMYKGKLYGMAIGLNGPALFYLPDHLEEAGLDPNDFPDTMEELVEWGAKLNKFDENGNLTRLGFLPSNLLTLAPVFGGGFYDWEKEEVIIESPENLRTLEFIVEQRKKLGYDAVVRFNSGLDTASFAGGWPFIGGAYSITMDGPYRVEQIRKFAPNLRYGTATIPPPVGGKKLAGNSGGNFMIIPRSAKQIDGAWDFIKFWSGFSDPETAAEFYIWGGWLPLSPQVAEAKFYQDYMKQYPGFKTFVDVMPSENLQTIPPVPYQVFLVDQIRKAEDAATRGTLTPKEALRQLRIAVDKEKARRKEMGYEE